MLARVLAALLLVSSATFADTSFWVWQRGEPLTPAEKAELVRDNIRTLYWQVGELEFAGGHWRWTVKYPLEPAAIPVIRLVSRPASPFSDQAVQELLSLLPKSDELQIDFDCPHRLLGQYAAVLKTIHRRYPRLSATALAGWSHLPAWAALQESVDELFPMFYDLEIDATHPLPLLDPAKLKAGLADWNRCQIPWRAGLPSFARITLYDAAGISKGHIRAWNWDDVCFNPVLATTGTTSLGTTLFHVTARGAIGDTPVQTGELVAARWPDREALRTAPARDVTFFRLPDSTDPSGWSVSQLTHPGSGPRLRLRRAAQRLELIDDADGDLEPRLAGKDGRDRGYALELDAAAPLFREALEGDFWRVTGGADPETKPVAVAIPLATRLTFWFSHLRAHESLRTGLLQLAPDADFNQVRYRILNAPGPTAWRQIESN